MSKKYLVTQDQTVDGMPLEDSAVIHYTTCSTAAATAAKTAALSGFKLGTGAFVIVKFSVTNTAASPTLNVNNTGAKAIRYKNAAISAGYLAANKIYFFVYDGTYWQLVGDVDTNTTYSAATTTAAGLMSAADKAKLNNSTIVAYSGVLTGTASVSKDLPSGKTKCLIIMSAGSANIISETPFLSLSGNVLISGLSSNMTAIGTTDINYYIERMRLQYSV
ncbi:MAG: hypothetical protein K2J79_03650, partial [Ruminiclostridium sp.]|nr:hypothetical protein [Ruminiclostridium sp.]